MPVFPLPVARAGLYPRHDALLDLSFLSALDSRVTFTRSGAGATYFNASGVLTAAAANVVRLDTNPSTLAPAGLLMEESRKNWITNSADETTGNTVSNVACLITTSSTVAPDGVGHYQLQAGTATTAAHYLAKSASISANTKNTFSFWCIPSGKQYVQCFLDDGSGSNGASVNIDTTAMAVVSGPTTFGTGATASCTVTPGPGPAMRIAFTVNPTSASGTVRAGILQCDVFNTAFGGTSVGNGTSGYLIWGAQLEPGAFATSHIPTSGSAVTRSADVATIPASLFPAGGTVALNFILAGEDTGGVPRLFADAVSTSHGVVLSTTQQLGANDGGTITYTTGTATIGALSKGAVVLPKAAGTVKTVLNAGTAVTASLSTGFGAITSWQLMSDETGSNPANGWLQRLRYWPRVLDTQEMQAVTS
jgi:hypothetical protein